MKNHEKPKVLETIFTPDFQCLHALIIRDMVATVKLIDIRGTAWRSAV